LQCVLAAKILTLDFVVCTLAVKKNQGRFRHVGSDHSLVSPRIYVHNHLHNLHVSPRNHTPGCHQMFPAPTAVQSVQKILSHRVEQLKIYWL
jgi:hypothetical protein